MHSPGIYTAIGRARVLRRGGPVRCRWLYSQNRHPTSLLPVWCGVVVVVRRRLVPHIRDAFAWSVRSSTGAAEGWPGPATSEACRRSDPNPVRTHLLPGSAARTRPPATTHHSPPTRDPSESEREAVTCDSVRRAGREGATATADSIPKQRPSIVYCLREVGDRGT